MVKTNQPQTETFSPAKRCKNIRYLIWILLMWLFLSSDNLLCKASFFCWHWVVGVCGLCSPSISEQNGIFSLPNFNGCYSVALCCLNCPVHARCSRSSAVSAEAWEPGRWLVGSATLLLQQGSHSSPRELRIWPAVLLCYPSKHLLNDTCLFHRPEIT